MGDAVIVPRWEWRTFGTRFGAAETYLAALTPTGVEESDETYLLSSEGDTVKVRDGLMDIKVLREVDGFGLERWEPVMKADAPLTADEIAAVFQALRQPLPSPLPDATTFEAFLAEHIERSGGVRAVRVHKRRVRYAIEGCVGELCDVEADGRRTRTIAIESADPRAVRSAVRVIGLGGHVNTSYPRGLRALVARQPALYATIDVGTNSVKFHIAERDIGGGWRAVVDRANVTQLGEGLAATGAISSGPLARTTSAIAAMIDEATRLGARAIAAVGTAGLRIAANQSDVVEAIERDTGVCVEVISGEEESRLAYLAVRAGLRTPEGTLVVFDTGGGSSQFTFGTGAHVDERFSVDVGAVRYTERFGLGNAVSADVLEAGLDAIGGDLERLHARTVPETLVGMGGAVTNMTAVMLGLDPYDPDAVQGSVLHRAEVDRQIELYRSMSGPDRRAIVGLQPKRAEVILAGACVVRTVMDKLSKESLIVSDRGLRHGLLDERFGPLERPA